MGVRLVSNCTTVSIPVREMQMGQLGEVVQCDGSEEYVGELVAVTDTQVISIGHPDSWDRIPDGDGFRVRILQPGEQIEIT